MTIQNSELFCCACGKRISYAQAIFYAGRHYCLDSILNLLADGDGDSTRVNVSLDLLGRLRDGILYSPVHLPEVR